jgi:hypothetical protein
LAAAVVPSKEKTSNYEKIVEKILKHVARPTLNITTYKYSPLMVAASVGNLVMADILLQNSANPLMEQVTPQKLCAVAIAIEKENMELLQLFVPFAVKKFPR